MRTVAVFASLSSLPLVATELHAAVNEAANKPSEEAKGIIENPTVVGLSTVVEVEEHGDVHPGVGAFIELDIIERWLELELEAQVVAAEGGFEAPTEVSARMPLRLARRVIFFIGGGAGLVSTSGTERNGVFPSVDASIDIQFWLTRHAGLGAGLEYERVFRGGSSEGSVIVTAGPIIGW